MVSGGGGQQDTDGDVLTPEELDIEAQEDVAKLDEGRYVIGADGPPTNTDAAGDTEAAESQAEPATDAESEPASEADPEPAASDEDVDPVDQMSGGDVKRWLGEELSDHDSTYAYHISAKSGSDVNHQQLATDDIGSAFDGLLVWYARQVAGDTAVDEALGILLSESTVNVRYPTARLVAYLEEQGLGPDDTVGDLVSRVSDDGGLVFPRRQ